MERNDERPGITPGTSEVHAEISAHPSKGTDARDTYQEPGAGLSDRAGHRIHDAQEAISQRVDDAREGMTDRVDELRGRAREKLDDTRAEASRMRGELSDRADRVLEKTGARARIQNHPLVALGAAFGLGYLLAGPGGDKRGMRGKARAQLRAAIIAGATAAAAQQARSFLGMESGESGSLGDALGSAFGSGGSRGTTAAGAREGAPSTYGA